MLDVRCRIAVQCFVVVTCFFARTSLLNSAHGGGSARWRCLPVALIASVSKNFEILAARIIMIFFSDLSGILFWERCPGNYEVTEIGVKNAWKFRNLRGLDCSQVVSPNWCRIHFDRIRTNQMAQSPALWRIFSLQWRPLLQKELKRQVIPISCISTRPLIPAV